MQHTRSYRTDSLRSAGFTLAELLIVVAIVLVLVAIAVPVFTGALDSSEEATCAANRRTVKVILADTYSISGVQPTQADLEKDVESLKASNNGKALCPSDGTYTLSGDASTGSIIVKCSKHGLTAEDELYTWIQDNSWNRNADDKIMRGAYAVAKGIDSWTAVEGVDNKGNTKTYYVQFKTYAGVSSSAFLYAGTDPDPKSVNPWNTRYICDSTGLFTGEKGQWYELPKETNIGYGNDKNAQRLKDLLAGEGVKKVDLVGNKFVAAS